VLLAVLLLLGGNGGGAEPAASALRVSVLDVGQGDSILIEPPGSDAVLVDAGPPEAEVHELLADRGIHSLAALLVTHEQSDHAGGAADVLDSLTVERLGYASLGPELPAQARAAGARPTPLAEGSTLRAGELRLEVLWPPAERLEGPVEDPNAVALVLLAEWRHFSMLLAADAEAELAPVDPGAIDVLKVAHHGSEDPGLGSLLDATVPKLAVISVGENSYGHPTDEALEELGERSIATLRTDRDGTVSIEADAGGWRIAAG
jgi:competence protein ComEC